MNLCIINSYEHVRIDWVRFQQRSARDRLRYDHVILIGSSDRENTNPNSLLPIESWHKSSTVKFRIDITWSWLNEKRQDWWYLFMTSQWDVWRRHLWVPIRERHGQFSACIQCLLTTQHGVDMPYLAGMCMWLTSLKIYNLLAQDWPYSSKCFPVVCDGDITDKMTNCCDEISDPTPIHVASRVARIMIRSGSFVQSDRIEKL